MVGLPTAAEARDAGVLAGPRKPALEAAFKPMGYSCASRSCWARCAHISWRSAMAASDQIILKSMR